MKIMQEARIVMPTDGAGLQLLGQDLTTAFNGYTRTTGMGAWRDEQGTMHYDRVTIFDIAMPNTEDNRVRLRAIAVAAGRDQNQKAVYVRMPDGAVEIIDVIAEGFRATTKQEEPKAPWEPKMNDIWVTRDGTRVLVLDHTRFRGAKVLKLTNGTRLEGAERGSYYYTTEDDVTEQLPHSLCRKVANLDQL